MNYSAATKYAPFVGRVLLGGFFLLAGLGKIGGGLGIGNGFEGTVGFAASMGVPFASAAVFLTIIIEVLGGLMLIVGYRVRCAAWVLAAFTVLATIIFHRELSDPVQALLFWKNMAITGGLLYAAAYGAGAMAMDKKKESPMGSGGEQGMGGQQM